MTELKWQDPPVHGKAGRDWAAIVEQLKSRPGQWALVAEVAPVSTANSIRTGILKAWRPVGAFEARGTNTKNGRADIYARYVGGDN